MEHFLDEIVDVRHIVNSIEEKILERHQFKLRESQRHILLIELYFNEDFDKSCMYSKDLSRMEINVIMRMRCELILELISM